MKGWLKKFTIPLVGITLPLFPLEVFLGFIFFNTINNINDIPSLLPLNVGFYR
jgi:hypothetical protein